MLSTVTGVGHPAVAALFGLGAAGLAAVVVAMAWSVHVRQIRLAELLARRQFIVTGDTATADHALNGHGGAEAALAKVPEAREAREAQGVQGAQGVREAVAVQGVQGSQGSQGFHGNPGTQKAQGGRGNVGTRQAKLVIDGPETVVAGEQVRYRVQPSGPGNVVTWAAGGGAVSQAPDPARPDELLLIADRPGNLMVTVRVREGLTERREMKSVTAVPDVTATAPPFTLRLFLHGWSLVVLAILVVGFAGALVALGNLTPADFIALVVPLTALLGVIAVVRGPSDVSPRTGRGKGPAGSES
jgi:hypothetical protein